jgi:uncharacterized protein YbbC (DUF1343 family)/CubicO group peptidase (beta-lactamase class C family)
VWRIAVRSLVIVVFAIGSSTAPPVRAQGQRRQPSARKSPAGARFDPQRLNRIDRVMADAIAAGETPGAVIAVGDANGAVFTRAYGRRSVEPAAEPMTVDTIFDAASLTKAVATTTAVMMLVESGRLRLGDRIGSVIPGCDRYGKDAITVRHLLTHMSGLRPDLDLSERWQGTEQAMQLACDEVPTSAPDQNFIYSDINFQLLGEIVHRLTGERMDAFARSHMFEPLNMSDTGFLPAASRTGRVAATERCTWPCDPPSREGVPLRGVVHDPTARRMGGVAGHAGLFTTASDLSRFARMLLNGGVLDGVRLLAPMTVARMTSPSTPATESNVRGLGWDIDSTLSRNRGDLMSDRSYGLSGFTGTSIWIDPETNLFVVFLSNRVHPDGKGDVTALRGRIATLAVAALVDVPSSVTPRRTEPSERPRRGGSPAAASDPVRTGIDVLRAQQFAALRGHRVGLLTNQTGRARDGASTIDLLHAADGVSLVALFSPEHGIRGALDAAVESSRDERTGLPIYSLYGKTQRPDASMLEGLDTIVVDLQDIGTRFYTYATTMAYVMEAAAARGIEVMVLDRPNPINGWQIEGPTLDRSGISFTGYFPMPIRHGMTIGELAGLFNQERAIRARVRVVRMEGWSRSLWFDQTGQPWVDPSPNMRSLVQATLYPGIGAIEWANISVGRGTDAPFEQIGAPWVDGAAVAAALNQRAIPGIRFYPVSFTPASSKYAGEACRGVFMVVTDRDAVRPVRVGIELLSTLRGLYPSALDMGDTARLLGSRERLQQVLDGVDPEQIEAAWAADEARWRQLRAPYLLYR